MDATIEKVWHSLHSVKDPEIPVVDVVELGIVRDVEIKDDKVSVKITPTYSGCPAMRVIEEEIKTTLAQQGFAEVAVQLVLSPPWTTDWLSEETKKKLVDYGIAPPHQAAHCPMPFSAHKEAVACPFCSSQQTAMRSEFGSTPCKAMYYCNGCEQPFEYFKCI